MKLTPLLLMMLAVTTQVTIARPVRAWSYEELTKESDVVIIVSVSEASERTSEEVKFHDQTMDSVLTKFKVQAILKGSYEPSTIDFHHLTYPKDTQIIIDGWGFKWFGKKNETFLVFLKKMDSGILVPTTGQEDLGISFVNIQQDMPIPVQVIYSSDENISAEIISSWGRQADFFRSSRFIIIGWNDAKELLRSDACSGGKQYHTRWLTLYTLNGTKYLTKQPEIDAVYDYLKKNNLTVKIGTE